MQDLSEQGQVLVLVQVVLQLLPHQGVRTNGRVLVDAAEQETKP